MDFEEENFVEAIFEGKIVKVPERYAKREGLPILKKPRAIQLQRATANLPPGKIKMLAEQDRKHPMDLLKKQPTLQEKQVISELIDNFTWHIKSARRTKGITRSQLARLINEPENNLKMLEFGILPSPDFQLINKVQTALGINLRKDGKSFEQIQDVISKAKSEQIKRQLKPKLSGKDIEILPENEDQ